MDEIIRDENIESLELISTILSHDKQIRLIRAFEYDKYANKKYLRSTALLIRDEILTSNHIDTTHFFEELFLFDQGNEQNRYFSIEQHKNVKNLKLNSTQMYISKSEARAMYKIYNQAFLGYSLIRLLETEYRFTAESLSELLYYDGFLDIAPQKLLS